MDAVQQPVNALTPTVPPRPRMLDVATAFVIAAAAVNVGIGVLLVVTASSARVQVAPGLLVAVVAITVVYSAALVALAWLTRAGRTWARGAFATVSALSLLTIFALNAYNLLVIVLLVIADVLFYRRSVTAWIRALRGLLPA